MTGRSEENSGFVSALVRVVWPLPTRSTHPRHDQGADEEYQRLVDGAWVRAPPEGRTGAAPPFPWGRGVVRPRGWGLWAWGISYTCVAGRGLIFEWAGFPLLVSDVDLL